MTVERHLAYTTTAHMIPFRRNINKPKFKCTYENCGKVYIYRKSFETHIREIHPIVHYCDVEECRMSFKTKKYLEKHSKSCYTRLDAGELDYACDFDGCGFETYSIKNLRAHKISEHNAAKGQYSCHYEHCGKVFKQRDISDHLMQHNNRKLLRDKAARNPNIVLCDMPCDFYTIHSGSMRQHKIYMHKERYVKSSCDAPGCKKVFKYRSSLLRHRKKKHGLE